VFFPVSSAVLALLLIGAFPVISPAQAPPAPKGATTQAKPAVTSDLDAFMEKVLARREINRKMLNQYVLDETETFDVFGAGQWPLYRSKRDYTWYERDGMHVRSPVRFNGVTVTEAERQKYEADWIHREKERQEHKAKNAQEKREKGDISIGSEGVQVTSGGAVTSEPRFVSEAYFMDFKFEPGNYYLAGREKLEGQDVLKIEYYPTNLFNDEDDEKTPHEMKKKSKDEKREQQQEQDINRKMNKTALVTLWVDPAEHQIVKYTFDNVWLDFLPAAWLVRVDDIRASMTMGQPFPGVWLPRGMNIQAGLTLALGSFEATYGRTFTNYREADVKTKITVPKLSADATDSREPVARVLDASSIATSRSADHGPFVADDQQAVETVHEIRVHGNAAVTDEDVIKLAGVTVGDVIGPDAVKGIEKRLKDSDRFETVEVRKRYRSLDDPTDVAIVLVVHERPGVTSAASGGIHSTAGPWHRVTSRLMFFPIISYADGYGFTYGARVSTIDLLGAGERLSVPLTWGGTKRAAIEAERGFRAGPVSRLFGSFGIWNQENPHFEIDDQRIELKGRAERQFAHMFRLGVDASRSSVEFGDLNDDIWTFGTDAALDTRRDPSFPGNAVYLGAGWSALNVRGAERINRYETDARGYLRVIRQAVVAGRVQYFTTDATLPPYERLLLGGSANLRGFRTGTFIGDRMLVTSGELRVPLTSVLHGAKLGVSAFMDVAKIGEFGASFQDALWHRGAGGGVFIIAPMVKLNFDIAHGFGGGGTRLNLGTGFSF
jgi:surface antigen Omp85-like protein/surface antigen-like variable number repeat protein